MQSKELVPGQLSVQGDAGQCDSSKGPDQACSDKQIPELVKIEVANVEGEIVLVHSEPKDGSAIEAAAELQKLTELLTEKAGELKQKADQAFLGTSDGEALAHSVAQTEHSGSCHNAKILGTEVQEIVTDVCEGIREIKPKNGEAIDHAAALDKVAEVLETKAAEIREKKIELTASELNSLDGFDR